MAGPFDLTTLARDLIGTTGLQGQIATDARNTQLAQQQAGAQTALMNAQAADAQRKAQMRQQFDVDVAEYLADPTPEAVRALASRYPEYAQELKQGWQLKDEAQVRSDRTVIGSAHAAIRNGRVPLAISTLKRRRDAEKARGLDTAPLDEQIAALESGDKAAIKSVEGALVAQLAASDENFGTSYENIGGEVQNGFTLSPGGRRYDAEGNLIASAPFAPRPVSVGEGETVIEYDPNNTGGGDPASSGSAGGGDTTRLINNDAGGGYVPESVKTLGQFVTYGRAMNQRGAKSSSAGTYQINGSTMAEFAPKALGPDWKSAPFDANSQERVAESIFNWARAQRDPAAALRGRWVSLTPQESDRLVQGSWSQARGLIAQKESGGPVQGGGPRVIAQGAPKSDQYRTLTREEKQAQGLNPDIAYQVSPTGQIAAIGGQDTRARQGRAVPDGTAKRVEGAVGIRDALDRSLSTFRDDYAGNTVTGGLENTMQAWLGTGTPGQRDWWADFRQNDNQIRNDLFGSALTATEKAAFEATTISERMRPSEVRKNLQRRASIIKRALARQQNFLKKNGYDAEAVDALYAADPLSSPPVRVRSVQEAQKLAPGTIYIAPDGKARRR